MLVLRQVLILTEKNLRIALLRHVLSTSFRALVLPVAFIVFLGFAQNFFIEPSSYGIGMPTPVLSLLDAIKSPGVPSKLVIVNNNFTGGDIDRVVDSITGPIKSAGKEVAVVSAESQLLDTCRQSITQTSNCYAAVVFHSSPSEGSGGIWNYTIRIDAARGQKINVRSSSNDVERYPIPLQHAIDWTIASLNASVARDELPEAVLQYPYTDETEAERKDGIHTRYQDTIRTALAVAFFLSQVGVIFHLVGFMSYEREQGISQLLEAMMPNRQRWQPQVARLLSYHLSFVIIYLPGWIIVAVVLKYVVYVHTRTSILLGFYILSGLALTSSAIFGAAFFRRARLSAITVTGLSLILGILGMVFGGSGNWTVGLLSLFFPPITVINFTIGLTYYEVQDLSINLYLGAPGQVARFPGLIYWYCLLLQTLIFPLLAPCVERVLYSANSIHRHVDRTAKISPHPIRLKLFSKIYRPRWYHRLLAAVLHRNKPTVRAVEGLTTNIGGGQITVLLGPNGSGKTTTLRCVAGIDAPSGGSVEIDGSGGLGVCPQENVFWNLLTVEEHVRILSALKRVVGEDPKHRIHDLIRSCDLEMKTHALAKTLSGGQKRKLQLAMMFTAGSQICCVDEVSSGLDPQSRRKIWEILLAQRGERTILLTTHFLDEADSLADRILILSEGSLKAEGSAVELKQRWGAGYAVHFSNPSGLRLHARAESNTATDTLPVQETVFVAHSSKVMRVLDDLKEQGITDYQISGPSIENVFFNVLGVPFSSSEITLGTDLDVQLGQPSGLLRSIQILLEKRLAVLRRNWGPHILALLIVPVAAGAASIFLHNYNGLLCGSELPATATTVYTPSRLQILDFVIGPSSQISSAVFGRLAMLVGLERSLHLVESLEEFNQYIEMHHANVTPGGIFLATNTSAPQFAYLANGPIYNAIFTQNVMNNVLTNVSTVAQFSEFSSQSQPGIGNTLQFILYFGLAMTTYAGFFALYPTTERQQNIRALHYSNGLRCLPLWIAYTLFDLAFVLVATVVTMVILSVLFKAWFAIGYLFAVLLLYGLVSLLLSFVISLFAKSQLAAFAFAAGGQAVMFVIYIVVYLSILTSASLGNLESSVNLAHYLLAIVMPPGNLARALLVSLNIFSISCRGSALVPHPGDINAYGGPILYLLTQSCMLLAFLVWWDFGPRPSGLRRKLQHGHPEETELLDLDMRTETQRVVNSEDSLKVLHASKSFGGRKVVDDVTFGVPRGEVFALLGPNGAGKTTLMALIRGELPLADTRGEVLVRGISLSQNLASFRAHLGFCPQFDAIDAMTVTEHLRLYAKIKGVRNVNAHVGQVLQLLGLVPLANRLGAQLSGGYKRRLSLGIALIGNPDVLLLDEPSSGLDVVAKRAIWEIMKSASRGRSIVLTTHSMEEADALADRAGIMERRMLALGTVRHLRQRYGDSYTVHLVSRTATHTSEEEMERLRRWVVTNIANVIMEEKSLHGQLKFVVPLAENMDQPPGTASRLQPRHGQEEGVVRRDEGHKVIGRVTSSDRSHSHDGTVGRLFAGLEANRDLLDLESYSVTPSALEEVFLNVVGKYSSGEELPCGRWPWQAFW